MDFEKRVIGVIPKCYAAAPLFYEGKPHFLVAAERKGRCILYDLDGNEVDTVWTEPGGVMTMVQIPETNGQFLATQKFFSPHDASDAKIVIVTPVKKGRWEIRTLIDMPYIHRFGILERGGVRYFIACTVKSGQDRPTDDWSYPGKVYAAVLPEDFSEYNENNQLHMDIIMDGMVKNHGFYKISGVQLTEGDFQTCTDTAVISCENGIYKVTPPKAKDRPWEISQLLDVPASDAVLVDMDGDGVDELAVITPFHGDSIRIYRFVNGTYEMAFEYENKAEFSHAIYGGMLGGQPAVVIGHREGAMNLLAFTWDKVHGCFKWQVMDTHCGSANVLKITNHGFDYLVSANRETDEVALYKVVSQSKQEG